MSIFWLDRQANKSLLKQRAELKSWAKSTALAVKQLGPDVVIFHFSIFEVSFHGLPLWAGLVQAQLSRSRLPYLLVLHEFAFPIGRGIIRDVSWAFPHRAVLPRVLRGNPPVIVTTEARQRWLSSRWWLGEPDIHCIPVTSNLERVAAKMDRASSAAEPSASPVVLGVFGYGDEDFIIEPVVEAAATTKLHHPDLRLQLIGSPGSRPAALDKWRRLAFEAQVTLEVTGTLSPVDLSLALSAATIMIFPSPQGVSSRKTTLAACLQHGKAVVAFEGPERWFKLVEDQVVFVVGASAISLATAILRLMASPNLRGLYEARAEAFYLREMAPSIIAESLLEVCRNSLD